MQFKGVLHPLLNLACFVHFLKIINNFWKNNVSILRQIVQGTHGIIEILVDLAVFKLWIKTVKTLFWLITPELIGLLQFLWYFWIPWTIYYKTHVLFFNKMLIILR